MATATARLGIRLPDPTDLVNVTTDLNAGMSALDAAVGYEVVTSLPAGPYSGKAITVSTDSYRTYFSNGTAPASGSWVEIPNSSGTFGSNLKLASGAQLTIGGDVNLFRNAANVLRTNDALTVDGATTLSSTLAVTGTSTFTGLATFNGGVTVGNSSNFKIGSAVFRPKLSSQTTVSNTTTETAIATLTIPANDAAVGAVYRIHAWGTLAVTGTPAITFRSRIGGAAGTTIVTLISALAVRSGATDGFWSMDLKVAFTSIGSGTSANIATEFQGVHNFTTSVSTYTQVGPIISNGTGGFDSTTSQDLVIDALWGTASASNTVVCRGYTAERIA